MLAILVISSLVFFIFASRISGRIRSLSNEADKAIDEHGRILGNVKASKVNDEIGDLSRNLSSVVSRLGQYNHYLENMASRLSHELRTPIAVVRTSLENLAFLDLPDNATAYIERAKSGTQRLSKIITDMSEATRLEQMLLTTDKIVFDLNLILRGCVQGYQQIYPDINFAINSINSNANINGSPEHIAQLLDKIINNAIDFSCDKHISLAIYEDRANYIIAVSNNGPLLPENMSNDIFDSMISFRGGAKQETPHLGLGLYIARLICEFHFGSIKAQNHHDPDGVTIEITLPKAE